MLTLLINTKMKTYNLENHGEVKVYPMPDLWRQLKNVQCIILRHKIRARQVQGLKDETLREEVVHLIQDKEIWWFPALYLYWLWKYGYENHPMELDAKEWRNVPDFKTKRPARNYRKYK